MGTAGQPVVAPTPETFARRSSGARAGRVCRKHAPGLTMQEENFFLLLAVIIGLFSGLAVACFRIAIDYTRLWLLGSAISPGPMRVLVVPAVAGLALAFLVLHFFRTRARKRSQPHQGRRLHLRWLHPVRHRHRKFFDVRAGHRQRSIARPRRSIAANGRGNGFGARTASAPLARKGAPDRAGRRRGRPGCGVQRADFSGAVRNRRSHRHLERRHPGRRGAGCGVQRGCRAILLRRRADVPDSGVPHGASAGAGHLCRARSSRRRGLAACSWSRSCSSAPGSSCCRAGHSTCNLPSRDCHRNHRAQVPAGDGRRLRLHGPGHARPILVASSGRPGAAESCGTTSVAFQRRSRWNLRADAFRRSDGRRCGWHAATSLFPEPYRTAGPLRIWSAWARSLPASCACQ